jgi:hypothetical protein
MDERDTDDVVVSGTANPPEQAGVWILVHVLFGRWHIDQAIGSHGYKSCVQRYYVPLHHKLAFVT